MHSAEPTEEELLNWIAAIQAAAEILEDNDDLSPTDRGAFLAAIRTETARLQASVRRMASLFPDCLRRAASA